MYDIHNKKLTYTDIVRVNKIFHTFEKFRHITLSLLGNSTFNTAYYPLQQGNNKNAECVFRDFRLKNGQGDWSGEGCY